LFDSLETELYFWHAEKGCKTNANSQVTLNRALIPGVVLYGYSVLAETSFLKLINTSVDSLNVTDSLSLNIILNDTPYFTHPLVGGYTIYFERRNPARHSARYNHPDAMWRHQLFEPAILIFCDILPW